MDDLSLVTGGAGFIGSHVVDALLASGSDVRVARRLQHGQGREPRRRLASGRGARRRAAGARRGRPRRSAHARRRRRLLGASSISRPSPSVARSVEDPVGCGSVTHGGTVNALRQAVEAGRRPRSCWPRAAPCTATRRSCPSPRPARPVRSVPYAGAKLAAEEVCAEAADAGQITAVCLRFFNVYGPRQDPGSAYSGVISRFLAAAAAGHAVTVYGDGRQTRDFVYVADVVAAVLAALRRPLIGTSVLNVGTGRETDLLQTPRRRRGPRRRGARAAASRPRATATSATRGRTPAARAGCWAGRPGRRLDDGLAETWAWFTGAGGPAEQAPPFGDARV